MPAAVLKFGSSVLSCPDDYGAVADAIRAEVVRGRAVVAVVSAMGGTTDSLLSAARSVFPNPPHRLMGALLATGEEASVALLVLALAARGLQARGLSAWEVPVRTRGPLNDADPVEVNADAIRDALAVHRVVVMPGFVGRDATGVPSVLGRGGSDLTAVFLGDVLDAVEIRLVKDVDGVFPADPRDHPELEPFSAMTWEHARRVGGEILQSKAATYGERRGVPFRVTGLGGRGTTIG